MRLDKFLKVSRIIKRRTIAKELVDIGRAEINGRVAKPSSDVKAGDILTLQLKDVTLVVKVNFIAEHIKADEAESIYEVISEERRIQRDKDVL
jgi:ribosomal 50S subunit-recycling heat shock protein